MAEPKPQEESMESFTALSQNLENTQAGQALAYLQTISENDDLAMFDNANKVLSLGTVEGEGVMHHTFAVESTIQSTGGRSVGLLIADYVHEKPVGYGQIGYFEDVAGNILYMPFVVYTETSEAQRNKGYGRERLLAMNKMSLQYLGISLRSSEIGTISPEQHSIWQKLVNDGIAEQHISDKSDRNRRYFCFKEVSASV